MSAKRGPDSNWGHPVAYHPSLAHFFGSVNAGIFFDQLTYWDSRTQNPLGVYKKAEEWELETGLSYREQATARRILSESGYLIETNKRLEHRLYFLIDWDVFNPAFRAWSEANRPATNHATPDCGKRISPNDENAIGGVPNRRSSIEAETTAETTLIPAAPTALPTAFEVLPAKAKKARKPKADDTLDTELQAACRATWTAYAGEYRTRYGIDPVRNAKVNANVKDFVKRIGYTEAPGVAAFYVSCVSEVFVVRGCHALGTLLQNAEAYRTQWATGQAMTNTRAQQADKTQSNFDAAQGAKALLRARREQKNAE